MTSSCARLKNYTIRKKMSSPFDRFCSSYLVRASLPETSIQWALVFGFFTALIVVLIKPSADSLNSGDWKWILLIALAGLILGAGFHWWCRRKGLTAQ